MVHRSHKSKNNQHIHLAAPLPPVLVAGTEYPKPVYKIFLFHCMVFQICDKSGHSAPDWYKRDNKERYPASSQQRSVNLASTTPSDLVDPAWYFDSRATNHAITDLNKLYVAFTYDGEDALQLELVSWSHLITNTNPLQLSEGLRAPNITKNLLCIYKITKECDVIRILSYSLCCKVMHDKN